MQVPRRKSEQSRKFQRPSDDDAHLTRPAMERMETELERLEKTEQKKAIEEVARTKEMGDLSENAAYTEAKFHLRRINDRIMSLRQRLNRAIVISEDANTSGKVALGCTVILRVNGEEKTYQIVGSQEADPGSGRISQLSPLGTVLLGHAVGETVIRTLNGKDVEYEIVTVK